MKTKQKMLGYPVPTPDLLQNVVYQ